MTVLVVLSLLSTIILPGVFAPKSPHSSHSPHDPHDDGTFEFIEVYGSNRLSISRLLGVMEEGGTCTPEDISGMPPDVTGSYRCLECGDDSLYPPGCEDGSDDCDGKSCSTIGFVNAPDLECPNPGWPPFIGPAPGTCTATFHCWFLTRVDPDFSRCIMRLNTPAGNFSIDFTGLTFQVTTFLYNVGPPFKDAVKGDFTGDLVQHSNRVDFNFSEPFIPADSFLYFYIKIDDYPDSYYNSYDDGNDGRELEAATTDTSRSLLSAVVVGVSVVALGVAVLFLYLRYKRKKYSLVDVPSDTTVSHGTA